MMFPIFWGEMPADLEFQGITAAFTFIDIPHDCCVIHRSRCHVISIWGPTNIIHIFQVASGRQEKPIINLKIKSYVWIWVLWIFRLKKNTKRQIKIPAGASSTSAFLSHQPQLPRTASSAYNHCSLSCHHLIIQNVSLPPFSESH